MTDPSIPVLPFTRCRVRNAPSLNGAFTPGTLTQRRARDYRPRSHLAGVVAMLPASTFAEITADLAALQLETLR